MARKTPSKAPATFRNWFDHLNRTLHEEAELAGLFEHGTTTGTSRELFLMRALRNVLPPAVHIGSGIVVDCEGKRSQQVDIVVYDPRFPVLRSALAAGLYLAEGVIATIEVKSTLNKRELKKALGNCLSVMTLSSYAARASMDAVCKDHSKSDKEQKHKSFEMKREGAPYTYVFAYLGYKGRNPAQHIYDCVDEWWEACKDEKKMIGPYPRLPSLILSDSAVGLSKDCVIEPKLDEYKDPSHADKLVMIFLQMENAFSLLLSHLIVVTTRRLGLQHQRAGIDYRITKHLPLQEYFDELPKGRDTPYIISD